MEKFSLDALDKKLLALLQKDASLSLADLAKRVGLSPTPCWRRIQKLEEAGIIKARVALLDAKQLNVGVTVFVRVKTAQHSFDWLTDFARKIESVPEVVEFYRMSGDIDYLLKIVVPDIAAYDAVYQRLIRLAAFADVSSSFALEEIKRTSALPLTYC